MKSNGGVVYFEWKAWVLQVEIDKVKVKEHRNCLANKNTCRNLQGVKILPIYFLCTFMFETQNS